jgi:hypothetical protein
LEFFSKAAIDMLNKLFSVSLMEPADGQKTIYKKLCLNGRLAAARQLQQCYGRTIGWR